MKTVMGFLTMVLMGASAMAQVPGDGSFERTFSELEARFRMAGTFYVVCSCDTNAMAAASKEIVASSRQKMIERCEAFLPNGSSTQHQLNGCEAL